MTNTTFIKVVFFDLGGTLVGGNRDWILGAQQTLAELREKGVRLGVISNTGDLSRPAILDLLPEDFDLNLFDEKLVIFSSEVHVAKPNPEIFRLAIQRANVSPDECLFCTEESHHGVVAEQEGMKSIIVLKFPDSDIGELVGKLTTTGLLPA